MADCDQAIRLDVKFAAAYNNRGLAYTAKGDYDRSIADFDQAIRLDPKFAAAYSNRCSTYNDRNEYDHAMADCDQAIRLDVKFAAAYNNRGLAYTAKGDYDRAIADFDQAIRLDPKPLFGLYEAVPVRAGVRERAQDARPRGAANVRSACPLPPPSSRRLTNL
jgi:tetratricopeptide (TPR) repeat protein